METEIQSHEGLKAGSRLAQKAFAAFLLPKKEIRPTKVTEDLVIPDFAVRRAAFQ